MTVNNSLKNIITGMGAAAVLAGGTLSAGDPGKAVVNDKMPIEAKSFCDIFDYATLYKSDSGFVRKIKLNGRYQGQWVSQDEDINNLEDNGFHDYQHRRARLGFEVGFANDIKFYSSFNVSDGGGPGSGGSGLIRRDFFNDIYEMYVEWAPAKTNYVKVGKQKQVLSREYATSSSKIKTIERSSIVNEITDTAVPWGVTYGFKTGEFEHEVGAWLYGTDGNTIPAGAPNTGITGFDLPRGDSRGGLSYRLGYEITEQTKLHFDYVYTNNSEGRGFANNTNFVTPTGNAIANQGGNYEHAIALGTVSDFGRLDLVTDVLMGFNRERAGANLGSLTIPAGDDTWGLVIMPTYEITEKLEFVAKYAYMDQGRGQHTQRFGYGPTSRNGVNRQNVENYHTFYAGLNYYVCEDNLKIMAGYEVASGELFGTATDIESGTWMLGVRTNF